jgi:hypothetical protein
VSGNARQQGTTFTDAACHGVLSKRLTALVPTLYGHDKAFVYSRLTALFHTVQ